MSYHNPRIEITDSIMSAIIKMAEGNPGAITVLMRINTEGSKIDPYDFMGGLGPIMSLDVLDIYGLEIWKFYKDLCKQNLTDMCGIMRANQLGFLSENELKNTLRNGAPDENWVKNYVDHVRARLPAFGQEEKS